MADVRCTSPHPHAAHTYPVTYGDGTVVETGDVNRCPGVRTAQVWDEQQLETVGELIDAVWPSGNSDDPERDNPVYVRTPHGSYHFVVQGVERVVVEGEQRTVIVVREVEWSE